MPPDRKDRPPGDEQRLGRDDIAFDARRTRVEATKGHSRRGGNRGRERRSTIRQIQRTAQERQAAAWLETGQPVSTRQLTKKLGDLYGDLRDERKGDPGEPFFRGEPWRAR